MLPTHLFSGTMRFGQIDATEAQLTMMLVMIFTAVVGTGYWGTKVRSIRNIKCRRYAIFNYN